MIGNMILLETATEPAATGTPMPVGDALALGGSTTLIGVLIVFAALVCLIFITWLYPKFSLPLIARSSAYKAKRKALKTARKAEKENAKLSKKAGSEQPPAPAAAAAPSAPAQTDAQLAAVIAAAVAAAMDTPSNGIVIRSIRRSSQSTPMWGREGQSEQVYNRF